MSGIYIHVPFCLSKCVYCGFYSVAQTRDKEMFVRTLLQETDLRADYIDLRTARTLYFGGGTPSLLSLEELETIFQHLGQHCRLKNLEEITLEANPEQLTPDYCRGLRSLGISRLSIGVQSFDDDVLRFMGRRHTARQAIEAVENASTAGFRNLSIDLIFGVAERTDAQWEEDLRTALSLPIQHLSCYALTAEENSRLYRQIQQGRHAPVDDEQAERQYKLLHKCLAPTEFQQYEVSNYSLPGFESRHNSAYWDHTPYLGLGPAAHSFDGASRQWNAANLKQYGENVAHGITCEGREELSPADLYNETLLLALRTREGLDLEALHAQYGNERAQGILNHFRERVPAGQYENAAGKLRLTTEGLWFADGIAEDLFIVD